MALLRRQPNQGNDEPRQSENDYIAQEMYRKNVELAHTNRTLSLLRTIDNLVLESKNSLLDLTQGIAKALVENSNYLFSALFMEVSDDGHFPMTLRGFGLVGDRVHDIRPETISHIKLYVNVPWVESREHTLTVDLAKPDTELTKELFKEDAETVESLAKQLRCNTLCLVKLQSRRGLVGVLVIGLTDQAQMINIDELSHLGRLGEAAGIAIDNKLLFEENQRVLRELQESNAKLKALDEAKDEFISMASHQLRTPLTSIKGYLSMVLEGDVGKITDQQHKMLDQAFTSAQRMVYLIADLLNVSRLKTGKFVIETKPTYLPEVVEGEIGQLTETARAHNLELTYSKPKDFPTLDLDETKTRQVVMNFIDNAIYYTPAGGHIKVELEEKDNSVEFRVIDDGLGVPKSEQAHLFTKFYRAGNAKKARPDGTGLGLFMAKKVIVAQGGSLIFSSTEGKGSTFGFSLPKTTAK